MTDLATEPLDLTSPLPPHQAELALAYWAAGYDTAAIAAVLGLPESVVANELPKYLELRRSA